MAKTTKPTTLIEIDESTVDTGKILQAGAGASIKDRLAAKVILEETIAGLSGYLSNIDKSLEGTPISAVQKEFLDAGLIKDPTEIPVFVVKTKHGTYKRYIVEESKFEADRTALRAILSSLDSSMTKEVKETRLLETKEYKALFEAGAIPDIYKAYFGIKTATAVKASGRDEKK